MKLNFFRLWIAALTLMVGGVALPVVAAKITPQYDAKPEYQKYWTANFKNQVNEACRFLGRYINDSQTVSITITIDSTMGSGTFAYANMSKALGSTNTADKFIAQAGEVAFSPSFYNEATKDWKGNNIPLMVHEILHCLGFSNTINAFKKHISSGTFIGPKTKQLNNGVAPGLASDKSHFRQVTKDPAGVVPRMMEGGGQILSLLDLAVLADIGYDITVVNSATTATCLGFELSPLNSGRYTQSQYNATTFVRGGCGDDSLTAKGATESIILLGGDGNDGLLDAGTSFPVIMVGDDLEAFRNGKDNSDIYIIRNPGTKVIVGLGDNDKIWIPYKFGSFTNNRTYEMPDNTYPTYMNGSNPYAAFKVSFPPVTLYVYYEVKNGDWQGALEKVKQQIEKCVVRVNN